MVERSIRLIDRNGRRKVPQQADQRADLFQNSIHQEAVDLIELLNTRCQRLKADMAGGESASERVGDSFHQLLQRQRLIFTPIASAAVSPPLGAAALIREDNPRGFPSPEDNGAARPALRR